MNRRRRWKRIVVWISVVVVVMCAIGFSVWHWWIPEYRPALRSGERYAVDVSHYQGSINWKRVAQDGIDVAYVKSH